MSIPPEQTSLHVDAININPVADDILNLRLPVAAIGGWGSRTLDEVNERAFIVTTWGERFDVGESLAVLDPSH